MMAQGLTSMHAGPLSGDPEQQLQKIVAVVRQHLNMPVAFLSEFHDGRRYFRFVDADDSHPILEVGGSDPLEESYCQRVADGRLPELMPDAGANAEALTLPVTRALPVGAHVSIPLRLADGRLYGTLCCFSTKPDPSLNQRDLSVMRAFGAIAADLISMSIGKTALQSEIRARIADVIASGAFESHFQPVYRVADNHLMGYEALTRFQAEPYRSPDAWLHEAAEVGMATGLEFAMARAALAGLRQLPPETTMAINLSPDAVMTPDFADLLGLQPLGRIILELTEHAAVSDYPALNAALAPYRAHGLRIAADDAGAGYSCFRHVLELRPDVIKLDLSLTRNIDTDSARASLAGALTMFGRTIGSEIVAEGVETLNELDVMREIGVTKVQGYLLGRPQPLAAAASLAPIAPIELRAARPEVRPEARPESRLA
jgi:EAL domain-containing protein (putative c-di-GMP-specific phosphodiesterase class I)